MTKIQLALWETFVGAVLSVEFSPNRLRVVRERLYLAPESLPALGRLRAVHPGVWLGTFKKERFEPAHPLALYLQRDQAVNVLSLNSVGIEIGAYLRGETLASAGAAGWVLVSVDGFPIGWGKRVGAVVKNHYPRGWMA